VPKNVKIIHTVKLAEGVFRKIQQIRLIRWTIS